MSSIHDAARPQEASASAAVVLDERTGTILAGGDVHRLLVAVAHGSIKVAFTVRGRYASGRSGRPGPDSGPRPPGRRRTIDVSEVFVRRAMHGPGWTSSR